MVLKYREYEHRAAIARNVAAAIVEIKSFGAAGKAVRSGRRGDGVCEQLSHAKI